MVLDVSRKEVNDVAEYIRDHYDELREKFVRTYFRRGYSGIENFEEIFHETLISGIKYAHKRHADGNKENWLRGIFRKNTSNFLRYNKGLPKKFSQFGPEGLDPGSFPDKDGNPLNLAMINETRKLVRDYLIKLSPIRYQILDLSLNSKSTTMKEISDELKINEKTVRTRLNKAKERLLERFGKRLVDLVEN